MRDSIMGFSNWNQLQPTEKPEETATPNPYVTAGNVPNTGTALYDPKHDITVNMPEPPKPQEKPDTLKLEFPALSGLIDELLQRGVNRNELRKYIAQRELLALTQYSPQEVNQMLGRDENSVSNLIQEMKRQQEDSYIQIMKYDMPESRVRDILNTAEYTGIAPGVLLMNPDPALLQHAEKLAGERKGVFGQIIAAIKNNIANYQQSTAGAELLDAQTIRQSMNDDAAMLDEGLRIWNAGVKTTLEPPSDEELIRMGRESYEKRVKAFEEAAKTDEQDAAYWATHVRPPDSAIGNMFISAIQNSGFTIMSSARSLIAWTLGGPVGGAIAAMYNTLDESQREAGEAFVEALKRGQTPEDAYNAAIRVRSNNMAFLPLSNYGSDYLLFGLPDLWKRWAGNTITGTGKLSSFARGALQFSLPAILDAAPEGVEEWMQEYFKMSALGDKIDPNKLWEAFKMGMADSVIYSIVGLGGNKVLDYAKSKWNNYRGNNPQIVENIVNAIRDVQDMGEKINNGEIKPDDVVREDPVIFIPESQLDEQARANLGLDDNIEITEDENGNPIEQTPAETQESEQTEPGEIPEQDINEVAIRKSDWEKFAAQFPEQAAKLQDVIREGTQGVTAAEELAAKVRELADTANNNPEIQQAKTRLVNELVSAGRSQQEAQILADMAGALANAISNRYGIPAEQAMNLAIKSDNQTQQNNNPAPTPQPARRGDINSARVRTIRGTEIDIRYKLVEADSLITSTLENGGINPEYLQELQPRQRDREASARQIASMAAKIDPELLAESRLVSDGAPIIGPDMMVESGNGRVMALRLAYKTGSAENYRAWLRDNAQYFGLNPDDAAMMNNPVLVRERVSDVDRVKFTKEANESSIAAMSPSETAMNDANKMNYAMLSTFNPDIDLESNTAFLQAFASQIIPANERGGFMQADGTISKNGLERVKNALAALAYNDVDILNRLSEFTDDEIKNISSALTAAAPTISYLEHGGYISELSIRNYINAATKILAQLKSEGRTIEDYFSQLGMFDDEDTDSKMINQLLKFFDDNKNSYRKIALGLMNYADIAMQQGKETQQMLPGFEDTRITDPSEILRQAVIMAENGVKAFSGRETYNQAALTAEQRLEQDLQAWGSLIDSFINGEISGQKLLPVMQTPLVFHLLGIDLLPIEIRSDNLAKILNKKHKISPEVLKQIPRALADPIMIFKSEHDTENGRDSRIILTDLTETDSSGIERSILAAITLRRANARGQYEIHELSTVYRKDTSSKQQLSPNEDIIDWISKKFKDGTPMNLLQYVNKAKSSAWILAQGTTPTGPESLGTLLNDSIPNENDLANLRNDTEFEQYYQTTGPIGAGNLDAIDNGERTANLELANQMEADGKDAKTIRLATGWERNKMGGWSYEILDGYLTDNFFKLTELLYEFQDKNLSGKKYGTAFNNRLADFLPGKSFSDLVLSDIYEAPELYSAYPELANYPVVMGNGAMSYDFRGFFEIGIIELLAAPTLLEHEIRHAIQHIEGLIDQHNGMIINEFMRSKYNPEAIRDAYNRFSWEADARNSQHRINMSENERRNTSLSETEDLPRASQLNLSDAYDLLEGKKDGNISSEARSALDSIADYMTEFITMGRNIKENPELFRYVLDNVKREQEERRNRNTQADNTTQQSPQNLNANNALASMAAEMIRMMEADTQRRDYWISDLRKALNAMGIDNETFDAVIRQLRDAGIMHPKVGMKSETNATAEEIAEDNANHFVDENGFNYGTFHIDNLERLREIANTPTNQEQGTNSTPAEQARTQTPGNDSAIPNENVNARTSWPAGTSSTETQSIVEFFSTANESSGFHELAHHVLRVLTDAAMLDTASDELIRDVRTIFKNAGVTQNDFVNNRNNARQTAQEYFARAFETYLSEGKTPNKQLQGAFSRIRQWLIDVYKNVVQALGIQLNDEMRDVFDRLLTTPEQEAEQLSMQDLDTLTETTEQEIERLENEIAELEKQTAQNSALWEKTTEKAYKTGKREGVKQGRTEQRIKDKARAQEQREKFNARLAKLKEKHKLMQARQRERRNIKQKTQKAINAIKRMGQSKNILWSRQQEIKSLLQNIDLKTLKKLSLQDLEALRNQVKSIYETGKRELAEKNLLQRERIQQLREELREVMRPEWDKRPRGAVRGRDDLNKEYKGVRGLGKKIIDWAHAKTLGAQRFFDWLDGGKQHKGAWVKTFIDSVNEAYDKELRYKFSRIGMLEKVMQDLDLTSKMLGAERNVDVPHPNSRAWTVDELMSIYAGMKNERSRTAILWGNFADAENIEQAESWAAKCIEALTDTEKQLADKIIEEYETHFDRINEALIDIYNQGMEHEENYTPMRRLEYTAHRTMLDPDASEKLLTAQSGSGMGTVEKGFSISRKKFSQKQQSPIDLGLVNIWYSQIEAQEHAAAFGQLIKDLRSVLLGWDSNSEATIRQMVKYVYGQPAWDMIRNYFNIAANDSVQNAYDVLQDVSNFMAKNMSVAYLCGNLGTIIKQMGSFPRVLPYAGTVCTINAIGQFLQNPQKFLETCYSLDPQLRNRQGDPFIRALQGSSNGLYQELLKWGIAPIGVVDRVTSSIVFKATYDANIKRGLSHDDAVKQAQRAVLLTQPAYNIKDKPLIWQQHGYARLAMMFTSDMAQTFGITLYDLTQAIKRGQVPTILYTLTGLTLAAAFMRLLDSGIPDEPDDPEEWAKWIAGAFAENFVSSIPLIGKEAIALWDAKNGYFNHNSAFIAPFAKLLSGSRGIWDDKNNNDEQAVFNLIEGASLLAPFPATALRRLYNMLKYSGEGEVIKAVKSMLGTRIDEKKLRRRLRYNYAR